MKTKMSVILLGACFLLGGPNALAEKLPEPPEGMTYYLMVLREEDPGRPQDKNNPNEKKRIKLPDVTKHGGTLVHKGEDENLHVILLPKAKAKALREDENVAYLQRLWMGESPDDWLEPTSSGARSRIRSDQETDLTWSTGAYGYDGSGNIKSIGNDAYTYDTAGRLIKAVVNGAIETYKYDSFGNLTEKATTGQTPTAIPIDSSSNRVTGETYDVAGNVVLQTKGRIYKYDSVGMVTSVTRPAYQQEVRMIYTADDERIGFLTENTAKHQWKIRDFEGRVLRHYQSNSTGWWLWVQDYVYAEGGLVAGEREQYYWGKRHFHRDHLGTVRMITSQDRMKLSRNDFYPFGNEQTSSVQEWQNLGIFQPTDTMKFTSHERDYHGPLNWDNNDYVDYMHARFYEPNQGRFLSVDPLGGSTGAPQSLNRYAYSLNNPINYVDPTGLKPCVVSDPSVNDGEPFESDCTTVEGKIPKVGRVREASSSLVHLMLWAAGGLPRHQSASSAEAVALASSPAMDNIREQYKAEDCRSDSNWSDFLGEEFLGTESVTGQVVGAFTAKIRPIGSGLVVVHAKNTWGRESATRLPGRGNRGNPSVQDILGNVQYFARNMAHGGGAPGYPSSVLNNVSDGLLKTTTLHYSWIEGSPCAP